MKKETALLLAGATVLVTGLLLYTSRRRYKAQHTRARQVSDEGYETAHDILFPGKKKSQRLQYGPVLPKE